VYSPEVSTINVGHRLLNLIDPLVMGVINITPDSFFDGGRYSQVGLALQHAEKLLKEGADILDIGAYSSRPNAAHISEDEEIHRLIPFIQALKREHPECVLSVDTFRSKVAEEAVHHGAHIVNDISGGGLDDRMFETIGKLKVPYILMHMRGTPKNMQSLIQYDDVVTDICSYFTERIARLRYFGIKDIILDPGPGFAKTLEQNFEVINRFSEFNVFGLPLLGAISRKSMIYNTLGLTSQDALNGTTVLNTVLLLNGAKILRVHDVKEAKETVLLIKKLKERSK
jgi:dihydropteroate synthase